VSEIPFVQNIKNNILLFWNINQNMIALINLLGDKVFKKEHPQGNYLNQAFQFLEKGDIPMTKYCDKRLRSLRLDLETIKNYDTRLIKKFRRKLEKTVKHDQYYGWRYEVKVCSLLIRKKFDFQKRESPDYVVHMKKTNLYIECTTCHFDKPKIIDMKRKLKTTIEEKAKKNYCNFNTVLMIDITNVFHHDTKNKKSFNTDYWKKFLPDILKKVNFGSIILSYWVLPDSSDEFLMMAIRSDNKKIDHNLVTILDRFVGHRLKLTRIVIPEEP